MYRKTKVHIMFICSLTAAILSFLPIRNCSVKANNVLVIEVTQNRKIDQAHKNHVGHKPQFKLHGNTHCLLIFIHSCLAK